MKRAWTNVRRFARIVSICAHHLLAYAVSRRLNHYPSFSRLKLSENHSGPERLRMALQEIGGTFIKFGQVLALQSDILPVEYCRELFNLLDRVPPFSFEEVKRTFVEEFERGPHEIFDTFAREPIATGSIGQVHVATRGTRKLAVKIRRPSVLADFGADIRLMMFCVNFVETLRIQQLYWIIAPTTEFVAWTREELDYRFEARYMDRIAKNAIDNPREMVPRVLWQFTNERILTTDFLEGLTLLEYMRARENLDHATLRRLRAIGLDSSAFARNLIDNFLGDAFQYGMFHADLHPANLIIMPSNKVGYIDFGIAGVLSGYSRHHLVAMTLAYARGDLKHMCDSFFHVSAMDHRSRPEVFRSTLSEMARGWYSREENNVMLRKSITAIMLDLLKLSRATGIWPQRDVVKYIRSAIALDGLIKSFAPGFNVGRHLETVCEQHLRWRGARSLISPGSVLGWLEANLHLARDGVWRAAGIANRFDARRRGDPTRPVHNRFKPIAAVRLAAIAFAATVLVTLPHDPLTWGWNPRSAGLVLAGLSTVLAHRRLLQARDNSANTGNARQTEFLNTL
jgi:ubiquinone biosynthesis protein